MVALLCEADAKDQLAHTDAEIYGMQGQVKRLGDDGIFGGFPAGCIAALQDSTKLNVWAGSINFDHKKEYPHSCIVLDAGDILVFRLDLIHSGARYDVTNVRIHCFLDRDGIVREPNATAMMDYHKNVLPITK